MITFDYYRIFYMVARYKSFAGAAEALDNYQPNITRCMNNLEHELDCQLFLRSNRGISLTPEGQRLYEHVAIAYEQLAAAEKEIALDRNLESGIVSIGASETALHLFLLDRLKLFHESYPHVRLKISNHSTPQAITALENGLVDFAVVTTPIAQKKGLTQVPLYTFREILVCGPKYRALAARERSLRELEELPFVSLEEKSGTRALYIQYFMNHGMTFHTDLEAATADQLLPLISHDLGIGFCPEEMAADAISRGKVMQIRLEEELPERRICLLLGKERSISIAAKRLVDFLKEEL